MDFKSVNFVSSLLENLQQVATFRIKPYIYDVHEEGG